MDRRSRNKMLAHAAQGGDMSALEDLITENRGLIFKVAQPYLRLRAANEDDCLQYGAIGIINAVKSYDPSKGEFTTWAWQWIRRELQNEGAFADGLATGAHQDKLIINRVRDDLLNELGREPTDDELVKAAHTKFGRRRVSAEKVLALDHHTEPAYLDEKMPSRSDDTDGGTLYDIIADDASEVPERVVVDAAAAEAFVKYLRRRLSPTKFTVVCMRYGLGQFRDKEHEVAEIAGILKMKHDTVHHYLQTAIASLEGETSLCEMQNIIQ